MNADEDDRGVFRRNLLVVGALHLVVIGGLWLFAISKHRTRPDENIAWLDGGGLPAAGLDAQPTPAPADNPPGRRDAERPRPCPTTWPLPLPRRVLLPARLSSPLPLHWSQRPLRPQNPLPAQRPPPPPKPKYTPTESPKHKPKSRPKASATPRKHHTPKPSPHKSPTPGDRDDGDDDSDKAGHAAKSAFKKAAGHTAARRRRRRGRHRARFRRRPPRWQGPCRRRRDRRAISAGTTPCYTTVFTAAGISPPLLSPPPRNFPPSSKSASRKMAPFLTCPLPNPPVMK